MGSSWCSVNTYTNIIMKSLLVFAFILSLNYVTARPQAAGETPEITKETKICEEPRDGDSFSLCHFYNWFTDLSNLIRTTGDVVEWGVTWNHLSRVSANILMMLLTIWMTIMRRESEVDMTGSKDPLWTWLKKCLTPTPKTRRNNST